MARPSDDDDPLGTAADKRHASYLLLAQLLGMMCVRFAMSPRDTSSTVCFLLAASAVVGVAVACSRYFGSRTTTIAS